MTETPPSLTPIVPLQQTDNDAPLLSLKEISERLGVSYGRLRGFAEVPGIAPYVGAVAVPGLKGVRYHPQAETQFLRLLQAQEREEITVKTAKTWLAGLLETPVVPLLQMDNSDGNARLSQTRTGQADALLTKLDRLADALEAAKAVPVDRLVGREEAAALLACRPENVSRYVKPARRSAWKHSALIAYIAGL